MADTILETLKAGGRMFGADDLKPIDAELCEDIAATAKKIDAGKLLSPPPGKSRGAKSLARALDGFQREAAVKYADELLKPNDSDLMTKIKQRLLMSMALAQSGAAFLPDLLRDAKRAPRPPSSSPCCGARRTGATATRPRAIRN